MEPSSDKDKLRDEYIKMAEECQEKGKGLTQWEESFLESVLNRMGAEGKYLTDRQVETLHSLFQEKVNGRRY